MAELTDPQRRVLREIDRGVVVWDRIDQRWRTTTWPPSARKDMIQRLVDRGLAERGLPRGMGFVDAVLTEAGHAALGNRLSEVSP